MNTGTLFLLSLQNVFGQFLTFLPKLIGAIVILIVGLLVASIVSGVVRRLIRYIGIDAIIQRIETYSALKKMGIHFTLSAALAWVIKWLIIIATFVTVADNLGLQQINIFLTSVLLYIPNVFVAIAILAIGFVAGDALKKVVVSGLGGSSTISPSNMLVLGDVAKYAVIVFSVMAALIQLKIAPSLVQMLFGGIVLALALAFGLGGREHASRWLDKISRP